MISLKTLTGKRNIQQQRNQGFTIVELLVVIVVIAILALLVITTYSGIQAKARNAKRQSDMVAIQTQLEAYYSTNTHYPSVGDLDDPFWLNANMSNLDWVALGDPGNGTLLTELGGHVVPTTDTGPFATIPLNIAPVANKQYGYAATGTGCVVTYPPTASGGDAGCSAYTLSTILEQGGGTYKKTSLD